MASIPVIVNTSVDEIPKPGSSDTKEQKDRNSNENSNTEIQNAIKKPINNNPPNDLLTSTTSKQENNDQEQHVETVSTNLPPKSQTEIKNQTDKIPLDNQSSTHQSSTRNLLKRKM